MAITLAQAAALYGWTPTTTTDNQETPMTDYNWGPYVGPTPTYMTLSTTPEPAQSAANLSAVPVVTNDQLRHIWGWLNSCPGERPLAAALEQAIASAKREHPDPQLFD